jgi:hypothetical protein
MIPNRVEGSDVADFLGSFRAEFACRICGSIAEASGRPVETLCGSPACQKRGEREESPQNGVGDYEGGGE